MKTNIFFLAILAFSFLTGCNSYSEDEKTDFTKQAEDIAKKKKWNYEVLEGGLIVEILEQGSGTEKIQLGSEVSLSYKGTLSNGSVFDQTEPGKPFVSKLNGLIGGFQLALLNQVAGTKMRLVIPPHLGYGNDALDEIPANSILVFNLTIEAVR